MNRRELFKFLAAGTTTAVAAHFGAPEWMGEEVREEVLKDLTRTAIQVPGQVFDNRPVWTSVSGVRKVWEEHVASELARKVEDQIVKSLHKDISRTVKHMVLAVDKDLEKAEVTDDKKIIIQTPQVRVLPQGPTPRSRDPKPIFELRAGLEKKKGLFDEEFRVGYLQEEIYVG